MDIMAELAGWLQMKYRFGKAILECGDDGKVVKRTEYKSINAAKRANRKTQFRTVLKSPAQAEGCVVEVAR